MKLNSLLPHLTSTELFASADTVTIPSGMRRIISPKRRAPTTISPGSLTSASMFVYMPFLRSYPVIRTCAPAEISRPSSAGMGLFAAAALEATVTAFCRMYFSQVNFIFTSSVFSVSI